MPAGSAQDASIYVQHCVQVRSIAVRGGNALSRRFRKGRAQGNQEGFERRIRDQTAARRAHTVVGRDHRGTQIERLADGKRVSVVAGSAQQDTAFADGPQGNRMRDIAGQYQPVP